MKTYRRACQCGNRERESKCLCVCGSVCVHVWKWKEESTGKGFTGDSINTEKKYIRNTYLWYQKEN